MLDARERRARAISCARFCVFQSGEQPMRAVKQIAVASLVVAPLAVTAARTSLRAQAPAAAAPAQAASTIEPLHFHHVHLNSMDPKAAAEYYPKAFAKSATKTTLNGFEAVKTG